MSFRVHLAAAGLALFLGFSIAGAASADPLTDVGDTLAQAGVTVDVPPVPDVTVPETGVGPVDDVVDGVNETVHNTTDTVNDVTGSLGGSGGGGGSSQPPAATPPAQTTDPSGQPVDTGDPVAPQTSGGPSGDQGNGGGGDTGAASPAADAAGAGAGAAAAGAAGRGPRAGNAPTQPPPTTETPPTQGGPIISLTGAVPWSLFLVTIAFAVIGVVMSIQSALRARRNRQLRAERGELRRDVGAMQEALLPVIPGRIGTTAVSVAYRPAEGPAAGGDFYDVLSLADGKIGIVVGDVCGHGREALANTALVHYTVRAYLEAGLEPRDALRLANQALASKLEDEFVAVVAAVYDPDASTLDYATAGHPTPLIAGAADRAISVLTPPPLGVGLHTGHRQTRINLRPESRVWFFTDGLVEARNADGKLLGREGLAAILAETDTAGPEALLTSIAGHGGARDDMTAFVLEPTEAHGDGSVEEEIDVDSELLNGDALPRFLAACGLDVGEVERAVEAATRRLRLGGSARIRTRSLAVGPRWEISGTPAAPVSTAAPAAATSTASATQGATVLTGSRE